MDAKYLVILAVAAAAYLLFAKKANAEGAADTYQYQHNPGNWGFLPLDQMNPRGSGGFT